MITLTCRTNALRHLPRRPDVILHQHPASSRIQLPRDPPPELRVRLPPETFHQHVHILNRLRLENGHPVLQHIEPILKASLSPPVVHTHGNTHNTHNTGHQVPEATLAVVHGGVCRFQFCGGGSLPSRGIWIHHPSRPSDSNIEGYT